MQKSGELQVDGRLYSIAYTQGLPRNIGTRRLKGRYKSFDFWDGTIFGVTIATIAALITALIFGSIPKEHWSSLATLFAVPVAAASALIALAATRFQINYARAQDLEAARAVLPLALSRAISVARSGLLYASGAMVGTRREIEDALALDDRVIEILKDCVRSADPMTRQWLQVLIARYQVYYARVDGWCEETAPNNSGLYLSIVPERQDAIMDWAIFHALVEHFYPYARGMSETVPRDLDGERLRSPYTLHLFQFEFDATFQERIDRRISRLSDGRVDHFRF